MNLSKKSKYQKNNDNDKTTNNCEPSITQTKTQIETNNDLSLKNNNDNNNNTQPITTQQKEHEEQGQELPISTIDASQLEIANQQKQKEELELKLKLQQQKRIKIELFLTNYSVRSIISSDYNSILSLCNNNSNNNILHKQFFNFLHDDKCLFYGCISKETNIIIGSVCIKIIDGGYTAQIMEQIIDKNYIKNQTTFMEYCINISSIKYKTINRFRYIKYEMDTELIELNGFDILNNMQFMYCNMAMELNENKLSKIHNTMDRILYNEYLNNFEELKCRDIDNIICILLYYYKQTNIFINSNIFDLGINNNENSNDISNDDDDSHDTSTNTNDDECNNNNDNQMDVNDNDNSDSDVNDNDNVNDEESEDILGGGYEVIDNDNIEEEKQVILDNNNGSRSISISRSNDEDLYGDEQDISEDDETDNDNDNMENMDIGNENMNDTYLDNYKDFCISSISDFKSYLFDFMNCGNINVYSINTNDMNQENGALCFKYRNIKINDKYTYYYVFGNNNIAIISIIYSCYYQWKKEIYNKNKNENIKIFINKNVILNNDTLKWLFEKGNNIYILEKNVNDLDNDLYNDFCCHEQ